MIKFDLDAFKSLCKSMFDLCRRIDKADSNNRWSGYWGPLFLLSGWTPRWPRCGAWRLVEAFLWEWVSDRSFFCWLGIGFKIWSGLGALWLSKSTLLFTMSLACCMCFLLGMQEVQGIKVLHDILVSLWLDGCSGWLLVRENLECPLKWEGATWLILLVVIWLS